MLPKLVQHQVCSDQQGEDGTSGGEGGQVWQTHPLHHVNSTAQLNVMTQIDIWGHNGSATKPHLQVKSQTKYH